MQFYSEPGPGRLGHHGRGFDHHHYSHRGSGCPGIPRRIARPLCKLDGFFRYRIDRHRIRRSAQEGAKKVSILAFFSLMLVLMTVGCGSSSDAGRVSGTPPGTSTVTVTGSTAGITRSTTLSDVIATDGHHGSVKSQPRSRAT